METQVRKNLIIHNGSILVNDTWIENGSLCIQNGRFHSIFDATNASSDFGTEIFNATGLFIVPGLIDTHTYGAEGYDTHSGGLSALLKLRQVYPQYGVTSFLPSVPACSCDEIERSVNACEEAMRTTGPGATILGLFSEGICVNPLKHGAQVQNSDTCPIDRFIEILHAYRNTFRIVTLAPEIKKCLPVFQACQELGIISSLGHSNATYEIAMKAFNEGYVHVTHLFNAMKGMESRDPGAVGVALLNDRIYTEIIPDGYHVHPLTVKIAIKIKYPGKMILVTDSMHAAGTGFVGKMSFAGQEVEVTEEVALLDSGRLAASILTLDKAIRNIVEWGAATLAESVKMVTQNPANLLSLQGRGKIDLGFHADVVALNENLEVVATWCDGVSVFRA